MTTYRVRCVVDFNGTRGPDFSGFLLTALGTGAGAIVLLRIQLLKVAH